MALKRNNDEKNQEINEIETALPNVEETKEENFSTEGIDSKYLKQDDKVNVKKEKNSKPMSRKTYYFLFVLVAILGFGLALLVIALMNLGINGTFTI